MSFVRHTASASTKVAESDINEPLGAAVAAAIGERAIFARHDVTSSASWHETIAAAAASFGPVGILANNAGIAWFETSENSPEAEARRMIEVDQMGVFPGMQSIIPLTRKAGGGSIINIASIASRRGTEGPTVYPACKWAVRGMTKCAALEIGADNICVNAVHPGMIATAMMIEMADPRIQLLKREGMPEDVGQTVIYLPSDQSTYATGCDFVVDGGMTIGCA